MNTFQASKPGVRSSSPAEPGPQAIENCRFSVANFQLCRAGGFTLLEVLLAIVIAIGMLVVVLYFYQQAADLRSQLLQQTERLSAARLLMDRITTELRSTRQHRFFEGAFIGESDFLQFIKTDVPPRAAWTAGLSERTALVATDLKLVRYQLLSNGTITGGLARSEEALVAERPVSGSKLVSLDSNDSSNRPPSLLTEQIQFLHFRFWDGKSWQDSWKSNGLPQGIEVGLGVEPLPPENQPAEYPYELFRRVIYLPGSTSEQGWPGRRETVQQVPTLSAAFP